MEPSPTPNVDFPDTDSPALKNLLAALTALGANPTRRDIARTLAGCPVDYSDVRTFVRESAHGYARERVLRTDHFEVLVMTWRPGQYSVAHDHAGSICAIRILQGAVRESSFQRAEDGLVDCARVAMLREGEVIVDESNGIHALENEMDATVPLVTLHVYSPPLPELRRFAPRGAHSPPNVAQVFQRNRAASAPSVAIVGGGFSGTMTAAHLLRIARTNKQPLHITLYEKQAAFGEGAAYRTPDAGHLLNVPAGNMSAWADEPGHFLQWAEKRVPNAHGYAFLPRRIYGEYIRNNFFEEIGQCDEQTSFAHASTEVLDIRREENAWRVARHDGGVDTHDAVVLATGHRPPDDPIHKNFSGSRSRYIEDPWATLVLSAIRPSESVTLLGSGLTAVDVVISLNKSERSAPIHLVSRRGLLPASHLAERVAPYDANQWLVPLLESGQTLTARMLLRALRQTIREAETSGINYRAVIDGIRPFTARVWQSLPTSEARRFLRSVRPYWEVVRHRTAPEIGAFIDALRARNVLELTGGRIVSAQGTIDGVAVTVQPRGQTQPKTIHSDWLINCTGPGASEELRAAPLIRSLRDAGYLEFDALGLGVRTNIEGRALVNTQPCANLWIVGTLRKADLWESTAVPELRMQAKHAAEAVAKALHNAVLVAT